MALQEEHGKTGIFRLKGDSYIDHSTFRKGEDGLTYDTVSYEEILELAQNAKMPTSLTQKTDNVARNKFRIPEDLAQIFDRASRDERQSTSEYEMDTIEF